MARDTTNRVSKQVYLPDTVVAKVAGAAEDPDSHPATAYRGLTYRGSFSSALEAIVVDYDRVHQEMERYRQRAEAAEAKLQNMVDLAEKLNGLRLRVQADAQKLAEGLMLAATALADRADSKSGPITPKGRPFPKGAGVLL